MSGFRRVLSESPGEIAAAAAAWAAGAGYAWLHLLHGWIPHDEGTIAHSAMRVLRGQLPHADFDAMYTGGLALLHAAAFEVGGVSLVVPRLVLWGAFALWLPVVYWIARRFFGPLVSTVAMLVAVTWSVPNYPAAMPSWYNLFLATLGTASLLRYLDTSRRRWIVVAGAFGGLSILFKVTGVYFLAAAGLFLLAVEQSQSADEPGGAGRGSSGPAAYRVALGAVAAAATAALALLVSRAGGHRSLSYFALPVGVLVVLLAWMDRGAVAGSRRRFRRLWRLAGPLLAGAAVPVGLFLVPHLAGGTVDELLRGVFVLPRRRFSGAVMLMPGPARWGPALLALAPLVAAGATRPARRWVAAAAVLVLGGWVVVNGGGDTTYRMVWGSIRPMIPLVVLGGAALVARRSRERGAGGIGRRELAAFLLIAVLATTSLIQFPFSAPIYFMYVGPLLALALLAVVGLAPDGPSMRPVVAGFLAAHLLFAARWLNSQFIRDMGFSYQPTQQVAELDLPRGGLMVAPSEKSEYERLVSLLERVSREDTIYAGPDSPEVYFLSDRRNPTRALFEFLSVDDLSGEGLLRMLREHDVQTVVVNRNPSFTDRTDDRTLEALARRYEQMAVVGKFIVWWR